MIDSNRNNKSYAKEIQKLLEGYIGVYLGEPEIEGKYLKFKSDKCVSNRHAINHLGHLDELMSHNYTSLCYGNDTTEPLLIKIDFSIEDSETTLNKLKDRIKLLEGEAWAETIKRKLPRNKSAEDKCTEEVHSLLEKILGCKLKYPRQEDGEIIFYEYIYSECYGDKGAEGLYKKAEDIFGKLKTNTPELFKNTSVLKAHILSPAEALLNFSIKNSDEAVAALQQIAEEICPKNHRIKKSMGGGLNC